MDEQGLRAALEQWQQAHPRATFDEIEDAVYEQVARLHGELVDELVGRATRSAAEEAERPACPGCGAPAMRPSGRHARAVATRLGRRVELERAYYVCPACGAGHFPPGRGAGAGRRPL